MYRTATPPVTPPGCTDIRKAFFLSDKWRFLTMVHREQAKQMISKSKTLRMQGIGHLTELFSCCIPLTQYRRQRRKYK